MEFDARMTGTGQAPSAQTARGHGKIAAVFLNHHVGRELGRSKQRVGRLVDWEFLRDAQGIGGVICTPSASLPRATESCWVGLRKLCSSRGEQKPHLGKLGGRLRGG